jgi:hypothetical protein
MGATFSDRISRLDHHKARQLLLATGLVVLGVVCFVTWARRVDTVEVVATLLFVPIFIAFVYRGVVGGVVAAVAATGIYAVLRLPAIDAIGASEFTGLIASRGAAYLIFGAVGGWSTQVLEGSLDKLDLYDEIDDETGLYNARHLIIQTELEMARARRYQTLFSLAVLEIPTASINGLKARARRSLLRDLGRLMREGVRTVDHVVHAHDGEIHRFVGILPETGQDGAEVFTGRFADQVADFLRARGAQLDADQLVHSHLTFPGDDDGVGAIRAQYQAIDDRQHA